MKILFFQIFLTENPFLFSNFLEWKPKIFKFFFTINRSVFGARGAPKILVSISLRKLVALSRLRVTALPPPSCLKNPGATPAKILARKYKKTWKPRKRRPEKEDWVDLNSLLSGVKLYCAVSNGNVRGDSMFSTGLLPFIPVFVLYTYPAPHVLVGKVLRFNMAFCPTARYSHNWESWDFSRNLLEK